MIRMGRSNSNTGTNRSDEPAERTDFQENSYSPNTVPSYGSTPTAPHNMPQENTSVSRPMTEADSMARDIKEGRLSGFVGHGTKLTGETNFQAMLRVDGHLTGSVTSEGGTLIIGSGGRVDANVAVAIAVISGSVNGDIVASEKLELGRTARVLGNIQTPRLIIEDGAIFEGNCSMIKAKEANKKHTEAVQRRQEVLEAPGVFTEVSAEPEEKTTEATM